MDQDRKSCAFDRIINDLELRIVHLQICVSGKQHHALHTERFDMRDLFHGLLRVMPWNQADPEKPAIAVICDLFRFFIQDHAKLRRLIRRQKSRVRNVRADDGNIHIALIHGFQHIRRIIWRIRQRKDLRTEITDQCIVCPHTFRIRILQHILLNDLREDMTLHINSHIISSIVCLLPDGTSLSHMESGLYRTYARYRRIRSGGNHRP